MVCAGTSIFAPNPESEMANEFEFSSSEVEALDEFRTTLKKVAEWPPDSPLSFVLGLAPHTKGRMAEMLLARIAQEAGLTTAKAESREYDVGVASLRCEVKFSTEDPPRFQQVRDPRRPNGSMKYDYLVGISGRPHGLLYWLIPADALGTLMDQGHVTIQHAMSDTKWFFPSLDEGDVFSAYRYLYKDFSLALEEAAS